MHPSIPRLFVLRRDRDITGVSGPGDVADGVQWADGSVVLRWRARPSTAVWDSLDLMLSVHGHDGATRVVWADDTADRARRAAGRAYKLADLWQAAHGSAMFLVRIAGAELRDVLDEDQADGHVLAAAECSAQHHGFDDGPRQCIRAAQHRGDHIDEHGFHWSDTVAVYPAETRERRRPPMDPVHILGVGAPADAPHCRYCGADCSGDRSYDGDGLYACPNCARDRAAVNRAGGRFDDLLFRVATARAEGLCQLPHEMEV
jgi:hypothetical protein